MLSDTDTPGSLLTWYLFNWQIVVCVLPGADTKQLTAQAHYIIIVNSSFQLADPASPEV